MVRDPPRKSEQATCRAVQCRRAQRDQLRCQCCRRGRRRLRPDRPFPTQQRSEQRCRAGRERQHRLWLHGPQPQRERQRRVLGARARQRERGRKCRWKRGWRKGTGKARVKVGAGALAWSIKTLKPVVLRHLYHRKRKRLRLTDGGEAGV